MQANIDVKFKNGIGHIDTALIRNKRILIKSSLKTSGTITFNDVQTGDTIDIDGACAGTAHLDIDIPINPPPQFRDYSKNIFDDFDIA